MGQMNYSLGKVLTTERYIQVFKIWFCTRVFFLHLGAVLPLLAWEEGRRFTHNVFYAFNSR